GCLLLIERPDVDTQTLCKKIKGPDFPTGGLILNSKEELCSFYEKGSGAIKIRGCWHLEKEGRRYNVIIDEIPFAVNKSTLVSKIGDLISTKKLPQLDDVRDESTDTVRIVLSLKIKQGDSADATMNRAMAYLCKHTQLQQHFHLNLTCLVPAEDNAVPTPIKASLHEILQHWLDFRYKSIVARLNYELGQLNERLHLLEAFEKAFGILDALIRLIRKSDGRKDAHAKIVETFNFDDRQAEAILDLRLYKLAKLEIYAIQQELKEKRAAAQKIKDILASELKIWQTVQQELRELRKLYGTKRKTKLGGADEELTITDDAAYILDEKTYVIVTKDGWIKRQGRVHNIEKIRTREGDKIAVIAKTNTKQTFGFFSNLGTAFVMRVADIPSTSGYGDPIQKYFTFANGEKIVSSISFDTKCLPREISDIEDEKNPPPYGVAITHKGRIIRFSLSSHMLPSNKTGRKYMKPDGNDDSIIHVSPAGGHEWACVVSAQTRSLCFPISEITLVRGAGKGIATVKLDPKDRIAAFSLALGKHDGPTLVTSRGREMKITPRSYGGRRASRGSIVLKRDRFKAWAPPLIHYHEIFAGKDDEPSDEDSSSKAEAKGGLPVEENLKLFPEFP
ncbi:MAG: DNA gyrase subunit A, partial [Myxococcota bacterium]|nr:DNA gyrase subunit A [Myxococcota bacterium]